VLGKHSATEVYHHLLIGFTLTKRRVQSHDQVKFAVEVAYSEGTQRADARLARLKAETSRFLQ
jgi:hypothetical protein